MHVSLRVLSPLLPAFVAVLALAMLPSAPVRADGACPTAEGWTRLVGQIEARRPDEPAPPWEQVPLRNNGGPRQWLYAIAGGWEGSGAIYVGGQPGLYRSMDCGATWDIPHDPLYYGPPEPGPWITALTMPGDRHLYAARIRGISLSDDSGLHVREVDKGLRPLNLVASAANPDVAYMVGADNGYALTGSHGAGTMIRRTIDGGETWELVQGKGILKGPVTLFGAAAVDPLDSMTVYIVTADSNIVYRSTDGATNFVSYSTLNTVKADPTHLDEQGSAPPLWILWQGSFYVSRDRAATWQRPPGIASGLSTPGVPTGYITAITGDPIDPTVMYALVQGDEVWMYRQPASSLPPR